MSDIPQSISSSEHSLFDRVVSILERVRGNVVRAVNSNMVMAYWLIGREIVQDVQGGEERAEYGKQVIEELSKRLTERYGKGFSSPTLWKYRQFYQVFPGRVTILSPAGTECRDAEKLSPPGIDLEKSYPAGSESIKREILYPAGRELEQGFSPQLTWSHYRALMRVSDEKARDFYEREAIEGGRSEGAKRSKIGRNVRELLELRGIIR